jgi:hypothetical protein
MRQRLRRQIWLIFGSKGITWEKIRRQLEGEEKERKYITTREKKGKERKGARCSDGACVAFVACTRGSFSPLLSLLPKSAAKHA